MPVFGVFSGVVNVEIFVELFFIIGKGIMCNIHNRIDCFNSDGCIMVEHRQKQDFCVGCYVESATRMT